MLLDVEMPGMSGVEAVPRLLAVQPAPRIVMVASPTRRAAEITFAALAAGASDFVAKPSSRGQDRLEFERELLSKVLALSPRAATWRRASGPSRRKRCRPARQSNSAAGAFGECRPTGRDARNDGQPLTRAAEGTQAPATAPRPARTLGAAMPIVAIGASTGGPAAIAVVLRGLREMRRVPIVVTQHMPAPFLPVFAEQLGQAAGRRCAEAVENEAVDRERLYVAAGDRHLLVERRGNGTLLHLGAGPPENFCRPAVDPMLRSVALAYGDHAVAVVLTGMGQDGTAGCAAIRAAGGRVVAQDEATSVVWGMPGSVARNALADAVLPLDAIAPAIVALARRLGQEVAI